MMEKSPFKEFAFDVKLAAVVRVLAGSEGEAREVMEEVLQACEPSKDFLAGYNSAGSARVTEASLCIDDADGPCLFEVDGEGVS